MGTVCEHTFYQHLKGHGIFSKWFKGTVQDLTNVYRDIAEFYHGLKGQCMILPRFNGTVRVFTIVLGQCRILPRFKKNGAGI